MNRKTPMMTAIAGTLFAGGLAMSTGALAETQGLYSADELLDADVYSSASGNEDIGEVEDILLDNDMTVRAIVVDTGNLLDLGEKQYVVDAANFTVQTENGDSIEDIEYSVHVDMTNEEITQQPEYTDTWWNQTKSNVQNAWMDTKEGAESAWESTKAATAGALTSAGQAIENAGDSAEEATDETVKNTEEAVN